MRGSANCYLGIYKQICICIFVSKMTPSTASGPPPPPLSPCTLPFALTRSATLNLAVQLLPNWVRGQKLFTTLLCQVSHVMCHVSWVACHMSTVTVTCHTTSLFQNLRARDMNLLDNFPHYLRVRCHMSCFVCNMSHRVFHLVGTPPLYERGGPVKWNTL